MGGRGELKGLVQVFTDRDNEHPLTVLGDAKVSGIQHRPEIVITKVIELLEQVLEITSQTAC